MTARRAAVTHGIAFAQRTGSNTCDRSRATLANLTTARSSARSMGRERKQRSARGASMVAVDHAIRWIVAQVRDRSFNSARSDRGRSLASGPKHPRSSEPGLPRGFSRGRNPARRNGPAYPYGTCPFQGAHDVSRTPCGRVRVSRSGRSRRPAGRSRPATDRGGADLDLLQIYKYAAMTG